MKWLTLLTIVVSLSSCSKKVKLLNEQAQKSETIQAQLAAEASKLPDNDAGPSFIQDETGAALGSIKKAGLIYKAREKRLDSSLFSTNEEVIKAYGDHTKIYSFNGIYKVMVIPVEFKDAKFADPAFFRKNADGQSPAQDYVFGDNENSMTSYYKHASLGRMKLEGEVTTPITLDKDLAFYGEAVKGSNDQNSRALVVEALKQLKSKVPTQWWSQFDSWDLSDYDKDKNFHEPDGFIDAVILIYAGKAQSSCQRSFDPEGLRPASADVPEGPRKEATVECFNRIWPHRWSISLPKNDIDFTTKGPIVEGKQRPAMNGLKITDELFALDYNMQSEFSDRSTFIHEFGHSLSLPDVYSRAKGNSSGAWEVMSSSAGLQAQEMSSYSKISLGWLSPKLVKQGDNTSAYLGSYNFVANEQREDHDHYHGPSINENDESILSQVPGYGENVYRSVMVTTEATQELNKIVDFPASSGKRAAYSSRFNGSSKVLTYQFTVPESDDAKISFDAIYHVETETNFASDEATIKVVTDYDIGSVIINDEVVEELRTISGDSDFDTLAELNPSCEAARVLELRTKVLVNKKASAEEEKEFTEKAAICQKPFWVKKSYDLEKYRGQEITFKITYTTDAGYTEFGLVVDNVAIPGQAVVDFEGSQSTGEFVELIEGNETLEYNQFYLFEYRSPSEDFSSSNTSQSYNMDRNIDVTAQSFFMKEGANPLERFRMVKFDYQPGVLVWYFNSKYERGPGGNNPEANKGKGYLLTIDPKVEELPLPGPFADQAMLKDGAYPSVDLEDGIDNDFEKLVKEQRDEFICFSHTRYSTYLTGIAPECSGSFVDYMLNLEFEGKKLVYRRERFNDILPVDRYSSVGVGVPFRSSVTARVGLSTFRPANSPEFKPFKVYKTDENSNLILDKEETAKTVSVAPESTFDDAKQSLHPNKAFHGDNAIVEKKGFSFEVTNPHQNMTNGYSFDLPGEDNANALRRPRAKVYFNWR